MASTSTTVPAVDERVLPGIEALRALAALAVVVHHLYDLGDGRDIFGRTIIEGFGEWGVDIFFLLSAFLLCERWWRPRKERSLRDFYVRRALRIGPAYYAVITVLFLFFANRTQLYSAQGARQVLANVTFTHWLWPSTSSSLNVDGALWTLTIEMLLYAAMPLLALAFWRRPALTFTVMCALGLGYRAVVALHGDGLQSFWFPSAGAPSDDIQRLFIGRQFVAYLPVFAVGIGLRWLLVQRRLPRIAVTAVSRLSIVVLAVVALPSIVLLFDIYRASDYQHWIHFVGFDFVLALLAAPLLVWAARPVIVGGGAAFGALVWLGKRSYGLYLWHFPVILSVYQRGPELAPPHLDHLWLRLAAIVAISVGLAAASYALVEAPAMALARRLTRASRGTDAPPEQAAAVVGVH